MDTHSEHSESENESENDIILPHSHSGHHHHQHQHDPPRRAAAGLSVSAMTARVSHQRNECIRYLRLAPSRYVNVHVACRVIKAIVLFLCVIVWPVSSEDGVYASAVQQTIVWICWSSLLYLLTSKIATNFRSALHQQAFFAEGLRLYSKRSPKCARQVRKFRQDTLTAEKKKHIEREVELLVSGLRSQVAERVLELRSEQHRSDGLRQVYSSVILRSFFEVFGSQVWHLQVVREREFDQSIMTRGDDRCAICMDEYRDGQPISMLACTHFFHSVCIQEWIIHSPNCPLCRGQVMHAPRIRVYSWYRELFHHFFRRCFFRMPGPWQRMMIRYRDFIRNSFEASGSWLQLAHQKRQDGLSWSYEATRFVTGFLFSDLPFCIMCHYNSYLGWHYMVMSGLLDLYGIGFYWLFGHCALRLIVLVHNIALLSYTRRHDRDSYDTIKESAADQARKNVENMYDWADPVAAMRVRKRHQNQARRRAQDGEHKQHLRLRRQQHNIGN
jgi:Ring finger domain